MIDYVQPAPISGTICQKDGKNLEMNDKSVSTFVHDGQSLI